MREKGEKILKKWHIIVIAAVLVLVGALLIVYGVMPSESAPSNTAPQTESTSQVSSEAEATAEEEDAEAKEENDEDASAKPSIYDNAIVRPVMNGPRTKKLGEYSVIKTDSSLCTEDALADWYFNYVTKHDFNSYFIVFTDKDETLGCYASNEMIEKDVGISQDKYGDYWRGDSTGATIYVPSDDGKTLVEWED